MIEDSAENGVHQLQPGYFVLIFISMAARCIAMSKPKAFRTSSIGAKYMPFVNAYFW